MLVVATLWPIMGLSRLETILPEGANPRAPIGVVEEMNGNDFRVATLFGLEHMVALSAVVSSLVFWAVLAVLAAVLLGLSPAVAIAIGLAAVLLHWFSELWHQYGHARAARRTGYPMTGIRLWLLLGTSLYPENEPELAAEIHIRRALGGPVASFVLSLFSAVIALVLWPLGGALFYLALFWLVENVFVFTIGAFIPLGFNDGSTLLYWWPRRGTNSAE